MRRRRFLIMRMLIMCLLVIRRMDQKVMTKLCRVFSWCDQQVFGRSEEAYTEVEVTENVVQNFWACSLSLSFTCVIWIFVHLCAALCYYATSVLYFYSLCMKFVRIYGWKGGSSIFSWYDVMHDVLICYEWMHEFCNWGGVTHMLW